MNFRTEALDIPETVWNLSGIFKGSNVTQNCLSSKYFHWREPKVLQVSLIYPLNGVKYNYTLTSYLNPGAKSSLLRTGSLFIGETIETLQLTTNNFSFLFITSSISVAYFHVHFRTQSTAQAPLAVELASC